MGEVLYAVPDARPLNRRTTRLRGMSLQQEGVRLITALQPLLAGCPATIGNDGMEFLPALFAAASSFDLEAVFIALTKAREEQDVPMLWLIKKASALALGANPFPL